MSVNMFGLRCAIEATARSKNGQPAQKTTGVARIRPTPFTSAPWLIDSCRASHVGHGQGDDRRAEDRGNPEAPRHVDELVVRPLVERRDPRLERHAADGARARRGGLNLRVHRADVVGARAWCRRCALQRLEERLRIGRESLEAARVAEVVGGAVVRMGAGRVFFLDGHPADRIQVRHRAPPPAPSSASMIGHSSAAPSRQQ